MVTCTSQAPLDSDPSQGARPSALQPQPPETSLVQSCLPWDLQDENHMESVPPVPQKQGPDTNGACRPCCATRRAPSAGRRGCTARSSPRLPSDAGRRRSGVGPAGAPLWLLQQEGAGSLPQGVVTRGLIVRKAWPPGPGECARDWPACPASCGEALRSLWSTRGPAPPAEGRPLGLLCNEAAAWLSLTGSWPAVGGP